jgi:hypothetical protein
MQKTLILAGAAALLAACATGSSYEMSEETAAKLAGFEKTGDVRNCLPLRTIDQIKALDERNFLIKAGANDYYLAELSSSCGSADDSFTRLQYETSQSSLCRGEIIRVVDNTTNITVGSCGMSDFQKLEKLEEVAAK